MNVVLLPSSKVPILPTELRSQVELLEQFFMLLVSPDVLHLVYCTCSSMIQIHIDWKRSQSGPLKLLFRHVCLNYQNLIQSILATYMLLKVYLKLGSKEIDFKKGFSCTFQLYKDIFGLEWWFCRLCNSS